MSPDQTAAFRQSLLAWYRAHARDLPWRRTRDPYLIWISEIMLQQTRVAAVIDHYARFTARFPTVQSLAAASEADVLVLWSGLGYYRRARMLHRAAQSVVSDHAGQFPRTAQALLTLPGIGAYTSAAVASIAFGEVIAVVDGNVERVLTRIAALAASPEAAPAASIETASPEAASVHAASAASLKAASAASSVAIPSASLLAVHIRTLANQLIDPAAPSHFNQAMMELGATLCLPRAPLCLQCPVQSLCLTRGEHPTVARKPQQPRDAFYALLERTRAGIPEILLEQRPHSESLMAGMWQLPELLAAPTSLKPLCTVKHAITVTNYTVRVFSNPKNTLRNDWPQRWVPFPGIENHTAALPLTGLTRKVLKRLLPTQSLPGHSEADRGKPEPPAPLPRTFLDETGENATQP